VKRVRNDYDGRLLGVRIVPRNGTPPLTWDPSLLRPALGPRFALSSLIGRRKLSPSPHGSFLSVTENSRLRSRPTRRE
jgi:hypothetical protein